MKKPKKQAAARFNSRRAGVLGRTVPHEAGGPPAEMNDPAALIRRQPAVLALALLVVAAAFAWSYWPTLVGLVRAWDREPDYSHGFFVAPLALYFLWLRRDMAPHASSRIAWGGVVLILMSIAVRYAGALIYIDSIDGWSIPIWVLGVVWLFWGRRVAWWAAPAAGFLWFMVPLPWRVERWLSLPLQGIATRLSSWTLQFLGQPAIASGHTILIGNEQMEIAEACSGLRIFVGIFALAVAYVICVRRPWWERALLLLSALPVALVANATRIVVTGLLYQLVSGEAAHKFSHDISGWVSIPFAALLFAGVLWYVDHLFREVELLDVSSLVRREWMPAGQNTQ
ncbi:MAG: exosortase/archaeosortase family protein [Pirellulaceae bacterium]